LVRVVQGVVPLDHRLVREQMVEILYFHLLLLQAAAVVVEV
tara:strand:+ start:79 stop:201 length:123 start_codon:yes stop_codon:yes gene_type:complete